MRIFLFAILFAASGFANLDVATFPFPIGQQLALSRTNNFQTYTLFLIEDLVTRMQPRKSDPLTASYSSQSQTMQPQYELNQEIREKQQRSDTAPIGDAMGEDPPSETALSTCKRRACRIFLSPIYRKGSTLTQSGCRGTRYFGAGATIGFDTAFSQVGLGLTSQYIYGQARSKHQGNKYTENPLSVTSYLTWVPTSHFALNASVGGERNWKSQPRKTDHGIAQGNSPGQEYNSMLGAEYSFASCHCKISPEIDLRYCHSKTGSYHESGAGLSDLKYRHQTLNSLKLNVSSRFDFTWTKNTTQTTLDIYAAWQREFLAKHISVTWASIPLFTGFSTHKVSIPQNSVQFSADLMARLGKRTSIDLYYLFDWNKINRDHNLIATAAFRF